MPEAMPTRKCADCGENEGAHDIRKRYLCSACFMRYLNSKVLKRMESYRIKNQTGSSKPRLLLPLSGGVSSLVLLSTLDAQLQKQMSVQNRTAYDLIVAHVDTCPTPPTTPPAWYAAAMQRFPLHTFLPPAHLSSIFTDDPDLPTALSHLGIPSPSPTDPIITYRTLLCTCRTPTALSDILTTLLSRQLTALAHQHACTSILHGHSDSRLAALSLSSVASGRGGSVPASIADGYSAAHALNFNHPCRDLFKTELELYASLLEEALPLADDDDGSDKKKPPPRIKSQSIDELLTGYITSQGEKYPSIMANVVRTTGKLQSVEPGTEGGKQRYCVFCRGLMLVREGEDAESLCYGCRRMRQEMRIG